MQSFVNVLTTPKRLLIPVGLFIVLTVAHCAAAATAATAGRVKLANPAHPVVNVNTATETQLMFLPGVGRAIAARIVELTEGVETGQRRVLTSADELLEVRGIGKANLERMRPFIVLDGATTAVTEIRLPKAAKPRPVRPVPPVVQSGKPRCAPGVRCGGAK